MKSFEQFESDWINKGFQENSSLGFQCVAGVKKFSEEVFGVNLLGFNGTAYNGFQTASPIKGLDFTKIEYKKGFIPSKGDIIFFGKNKQNGFCGHVGIIKDALENSLIVLNQNMGTGTGQSASDGFRLSKFDYSNVLGVFRNNSYFNSLFMGVYEKQFKEKYGNGTIFNDLEGGFKKCLNADGTINGKEFFYFTMIGLERIKSSK